MSATQAENCARQVQAHRTAEDKLDKVALALIEIARTLREVEKKLEL